MVRKHKLLIFSLIFFVLNQTIGYTYSKDKNTNVNENTPSVIVPQDDKPKSISFSFDVKSQNLLENKQEKINKHSELLTDLLVSYLLLREVDEKNISLSDKYKPEPSPTTNSSLRLDFEKDYELRDLIISLIFLNSPDARLTLQKLLSKQFPNEIIKIGTKSTLSIKENFFTGNTKDLSNAVSYLFTSLEKNQINPFSKEFILQNATYPTLLKLSLGEKTKILIMIDENAKLAVLLASVVHADNKNLNKEVSTIYISCEHSLPTGQLIKRASEQLSLAVNEHETVKIIPKGKIIADIPLQDAEKDSIVVIAPEDIYISFKKSELQNGERKTIELLVERDNPVKLPITSGSQIGTLKIVFNGQTLKNIPLTANENISGKSSMELLEKFKQMMRKD